MKLHRLVRNPKNLTILLVAALIPAGFTPVLGAEGEERYALQWALLEGSVLVEDEEAQSKSSDSTAGKRALDWNFEWNLREDLDELIELFHLSSLRTLQQGRSLLSGAQDSVTVGDGAGETRLEVRIDLSIEPFEHEGEVFDAARATVSIHRGGEEVSRPIVMTPLGERAIVTTGTWDRRGEEEIREVVYIVIQVDPVE